HELGSAAITFKRKSSVDTIQTVILSEKAGVTPDERCVFWHRNFSLRPAQAVAGNRDADAASCRRVRVVRQSGDGPDPAQCLAVALPTRCSVCFAACSKASR